MKPNQSPEYLTQGKYTASDLRYFLQRIRGRPVPAVTLKKWRYHLGIEPDKDMLYTEFDRDVLKGLVNWLNRRGPIKAYVQQFKQLIREMQHHG